jgi:hypothetical protein
LSPSVSTWIVGAGAAHPASTPSSILAMQEIIPAIPNLFLDVSRIPRVLKQTTTKATNNPGETIRLAPLPWPKQYLAGKCGYCQGWYFHYTLRNLISVSM